MTRLAVVLLAVGLLLSGCSQSPPVAVSSPSEAHTGGSQDVTQQEFGDAWPLTVSRAVVGCKPLYPPATNIVDLFVNDNGTLYGLNGTALGHPDGAYKDLHAIWKPGFDVKPLQDAARKLC